MTASALRLRVGDTFIGWYGDGTPARLRVVATYQRGLGFAALTLSHDVLLAHTAARRDGAMLIAASPGAWTELEAASRSQAPGASLLAARDYQRGLDVEMAQNAWTNRVITVVLLVYSAIAAVNSLLMAAFARCRELALLRLAGATSPQVVRMTQIEQAILLGLALLIGSAIAAATLMPMVRGITGGVPYIPPAGWAAVIGGVVALGIGATIAPTKRMLRARPVDAIAAPE